jgi:hypothetical protein
MCFAEASIAKPLGVERRQQPVYGVAAGLVNGTDAAAERDAEAQTVRIRATDDPHGDLRAGEGSQYSSGTEFRRWIAGR